MDYARKIWYDGTSRSLLKSQVLQAGSLNMLYENGFLRYICLGKTEVIRMIYFAVRDHNWDTIPGEISDEYVESKGDNFLIRYIWTSTSTACPFRWECRIEGNSEGRIQFEIKGEALAPFQKNRVGFCILHPVRECAGKSCELKHADGSSSQAYFPEYISPHQPMMSIQAMQWEPAPGCSAKLLMKGDIFEMEDQRNWTDDSYKTYCTPLGLPFPVQLTTGDQIWQQIELSCTTEGDTAADGEKAIWLQPDFMRPITDLPRIGVECSSEHAVLREGEATLLREIAFDHLRVEVHFARVDWKEAFKRGVQNAGLLGLPLELVLFFDKNPEKETQAVIHSIAESGPQITTCLILHETHKSSPDSLLSEVLPILQKKLPGVPMGAGTNAYFTELNRERNHPEGLDFLSYSLNPQVHAFDNLSLTETLAAQAHTVQSAAHFAEECAIHISPITLKPRFNPNATGPPPETLPGDLPDEVDVRQMSLYGAAWTLGSIASLANTSVQSLTYYETTGWRGIMQGQAVPDASTRFFREQNMLFPMWQIFRMVLQQKTTQWIPLLSNHPRAVKGIAFLESDKMKLLFANFQDTSITIQLRLDVPGLRLGFLDETTVSHAVREQDFWDRLDTKPQHSESGLYRVILKPYAICLCLTEGES